MGHFTRADVRCPRCGVTFSPKETGRLPVHCWDCTVNKRRLDYEARDHVCGVCGVAVQRRVVNGPFPKFCGPCATARREARQKGRYIPRAPRPSEPHPCVDCGATIAEGKHHRCRECLRLRANAKVLTRFHSRPDKGTRPCRDCGQAFTYWAGHWTLRCEPCHVMWRLDLRRSKNMARRMRLANVPYEFLSRARVFAEDGWICGLCKQPVDPSLRWPDRRSATLDHIVPVSRGGGHVRSNVQLAHAICNSRKGATPVTTKEQQHG